MPAWTAVNLARYVFVPADGEPAVFEYGHALFRASEFWHDSRVAKTWQFRFAQHDARSRAADWAIKAVGESVIPDYELAPNLALSIEFMRVKLDSTTVSSLMSRCLSQKPFCVVVSLSARFTTAFCRVIVIR